MLNRDVLCSIGTGTIAVLLYGTISSGRDYRNNERVYVGTIGTIGTIRSSRDYREN